MAMRDSLLTAIYEQMSVDETIIVVSADFGSPVLDKIRSAFPKRFLNTGIAEQNLINVSSGLALEGFKVFAYAIAPFITMRCYEQIRVNLALLSEVRELNVNLIGVGAGYSYVVSGPTHQCYEDLSLIRSLPNFQIMSPSDHLLSRALMENCLSNKGPKYVRLDAQVLPVLREKLGNRVLAKGFELLKGGKDGVIVSTGYMSHTGLEVVRELKSEYNIEISLIDLFDLTSFDEELLLNEVRGQHFVFTLEEAFEGRGGLDTLVDSFLKKHSIGRLTEGMGVYPGYQFELGTRQELHERVGIGSQSIIKRIVKHFKY